MAGRGKPGPPAKGHEQVEYHRTKTRVLELLDQGLTQAEIARQMGYRNRSAAHRMIDKTMKEDLVGAGRNRLRVIHLGRLEGMYAALERDVIKNDDTPVDEKKLVVLIKILEREARLTGIDGPVAVERDEEDRADPNDEAIHPVVQTWDDWEYIEARMMASRGVATPEQIQLLAERSRQGSSGKSMDALSSGHRNEDEGVIEGNIVDITPHSAEIESSPESDPQARGEAGKSYRGRSVHWWQERAMFFEDDGQSIDPEPDYGGGWAVGE